MSRLPRHIKALLRPIYLHFFPLDPLRCKIAAHYLKGNGIETGALHFPLKVPLGATVRYVDHLPVGELRTQYPELGASPLVHVDVLDDGEKLPRFKDATVDSVIANHLTSIAKTQSKALRTGCKYPNRAASSSWQYQTNATLSMLTGR
jgi:hypothetical protein